ncbi:c-type cytochrome [Paenibacillus sp. HJGM_3]|uniref:c-type cytochrome n=1 Tax=Paenibacillus sp. HJGM_3 TaxID=3379816 RepID=UPI00385FB3A0
MSTIKFSPSLLNRTLLVSLAAAVFIGLLSGCGAKSGGSEEAAGKPELLAAASADTQAIYKKRCMSCHGDGLQGRIGPKTDLTQVGGRLTAEQIEAQIRKGGNGMPAFQDLKAEEIAALRDWLAGLR